MAHTKFQVEVLTPEGEVFNDQVEMVSTKTAVGSIGVLANHAPLLAMLDPAELRLYRSDSDIVRFAQSEGYLQVAENRARKIERFLSQPFFVAEQFTGTPGVYVPIAESIRGFKEILEGKHDDVPERAFFLKGTIDDVIKDAGN